MEFDWNVENKEKKLQRKADIDNSQRSSLMRAPSRN
jgi:hypothetical protein